MEKTFSMIKPEAVLGGNAGKKMDFLHDFVYLLIDCYTMLLDTANTFQVLRPMAFYCCLFKFIYQDRP